MDIKRKCSADKLSKQPLALVIAQIRFQGHSSLPNFFHKIQLALKTQGFLTYEADSNTEFSISPLGEFQQTTTKQWIFKSENEHRNVVLDHKQLCFQCSDYDLFESFYDDFETILSNIFDTISEKQLVVKRLGLRYIDRIIPTDNEDSIDSYIAPNYRVSGADVFDGRPKICSITQAGEVSVNDNDNGVLVFRLIQGERGLQLPPDLMTRPPKLVKEAPKDKVIGLIDIDHSFEPCQETLVSQKDMLKKLFYSMHDNSRNLFDNLVSEEGKEKWK